MSKRATFPYRRRKTRPTVFEPVRLPVERLAFEIADGLPDFCDDRAIRSSMKAHRLDVRTDHGPLARPVLAYGLAAMDVATIHTRRHHR